MSRRVLVTGASRGIGRAVALGLARDGFRITAHYHQSEEAAKSLLDEIASVGGDCELLHFDVTERKTCRAALERTVESGGAFYGIVSNAGIAADGPFPGLSDGDWDSVLRTNLDGFYNVVQPLVMPMVRARQGGRIVTMSSIAGQVGNRGQVNYSASKAGLIGATRSLSIELAKRKITVNSVAPGLIETDMVAGLPRDEMTRMIPMRRLGQPEEVAALVSFLFSDGASYITGQAISVNGGMA